MIGHCNPTPAPYGVKDQELLSVLAAIMLGLFCFKKRY